MEQANFEQADMEQADREDGGDTARQDGISAAELHGRLQRAALKAGVVLGVSPFSYACVPDGEIQPLFFDGWDSPECMLTGPGGNGVNIGSVAARKAGENGVAKLLSEAGFGMLAGATTREDLAIRMDLAGI